jgi:hypothetical protein
VKRALSLYQYVAPATLFPASYYLWLRRLDQDHSLVLFTLAMPVLYAYVIPGIGTNCLKLWEIHTRWRLGRFRPHHGFVFGTAASLLALLCVEEAPARLSPFSIFRAALITGSVFAFWNWLYDISAIRAGFISVYNRPYSQKLGPEAIVTDYAPVLFGSFGAWYGAALHVGHYYLLHLGRSDLFWVLFLAGNLGALIVPVAAFVFSSYVKHGESGLKPYRRD